VLFVDASHVQVHVRKLQAGLQPQAVPDGDDQPACRACKGSSA
jgi:hypothetical protein